MVYCAADRDGDWAHLDSVILLESGDIRRVTAVG